MLAYNCHMWNAEELICRLETNTLWIAVNVQDWNHFEAPAFFPGLVRLLGRGIGSTNCLAAAAAGP